MIRVNYVFHGECSQSCIADSHSLEGYGEVGVSIAVDQHLAAGTVVTAAFQPSLQPWCVLSRWEDTPYSYAEESDKL